MFDIYIKDYNDANGQLVSTETLVQTIPASSEGELKLLNPSVKVDMGNAESFNFSIEAGTKFYDAFNQMKTFMRVVYDGDTIFYGRILTIDNDFYGNRKLRCEGPLAFLNDSSIEGKKETDRIDIDSKEYLKQLIDNHNTMLSDPKRSFIIGETPGNYTSAVSSAQRIKEDRRKYGADNWQDTKGAIEDFRSHYGGYLRVRCEGHREGNTFVDEGHYLDWMDHYFNKDEATQTFEVGKNIIDISSTTEIDNIFTVVIPIGNRHQTTSETTDGERKSTGPSHFYVPGKEVTVPSICSVYGDALNSGYHTYDDYYYALTKYGRIVKTVVLDDAKDSSDLLTKCQEWIKNNYQGEVTKFTVKGIDLHQIGDSQISKIMVGDRVKLIYPIYKENGDIIKTTISRTCLSISYDLYNPENNSYTFGIPANILTKSYGLSKQGKSASDGTTKPKSTPSGGGSSGPSWLEQVRDWLTEHKIYYKHRANGTSVDTDVFPSLYPWESSRKSYEKGPPNMQAYFLHTEFVAGIGAYTLYKFTPIDSGSTYSEEKAQQIREQIAASMPHASSTAVEAAKNSAVQAYRNSCSFTQWRADLYTLNSPPTVQTITEFKIVPYVAQEYGINLLTYFSGVTAPKSVTYTDSSGTTQTVEFDTSNGRQITVEMFREGYSGTLPDGFHILTRPSINDQGVIDGEISIRAVFNNDTGDWEYWMVDPDDPTNVIQTSVRDLKTHSINDGKFIGSWITEGYMGPDGEVHIYKFGQEIETWAGGEMVSAHVDGDILRIGSTRTKWATTVGQNINGNFLNPVEYILEGEEGNKKKRAIKVGTVGQTTYIAKYDETEGCYVWDPNATPADVAAGTHIYLTGDGFWDEENLAIKGGIYTVMENNRPVTYITSKQLIVGNQNTSKTIKQALLDAGLFYKHIDGQEDTLITNMADLDAWLDAGKATVTPVLVAKRIYTEELNALNATVRGKLTTNELSSEISKLSVVTITGSLYISGSGAYLDHDLTVENNIYAKNIAINARDDHGHLQAYSLNGAITDADITLSGNTYTLNLYTCKGTAYTPGEGKTLSFSRAISSFSGAWDGNKFTVTASPQDQEYSIFVQSATNTGVYYSGDLPHWGTGTSKTWRIIPLMWYEPSLGTPYAYQTPYNVSLDASVLIDRVSSDGITQSGIEQPEKAEFSMIAYNSANTELKSDDYKLELTSRVTSYTTTSECVNLVRKTGSFVVGRIDVHSVYESGHTDGLNDETINLIANDSTAPAYNVEQKTITIKATTTHGYKSKTRDVALAVGTYQYSSTTSHDCVNLFLDNSTTGSIIGRIDVDSIYTKGLNAETITSIVNNTTAPAYNAELKTITIKATTTHGAKIKTRDVALSLTKYQYSSTTQHDCVNLCLDSSSGSVIGRIDINSVYTSGRTSGWNSCYSSLSTNSSPSSKTLSYGGSAYVLITQTDSSGTSQTRFTATYTAPTDSNLVAGNIKSGVTIFGVTGTYSGGSPTILASAQGSQSDANASAVSAFCDGATKLFDTTSYHVRNGYWYKIKITAGSSEKYYVFHAYA